MVRLYGTIKMKTILVCGAGGFIGSHMVKRLKEEGHWVRGVDLKYPEFSETEADDFIIGDLRNPDVCERVFRNNKGLLIYDEVYQFAADMGGAGYIFTGDHDADVMHNSATINLNMAKLCQKYMVKKVFYSSSACIYPAYNQTDPNNPNCEESSAYPADPDSDYGWEKLFSERMWRAFARNYGMNVRIARFHNIFGPEGTWDGGKEKAPAAMCRKVATAEWNEAEGYLVEVWGPGDQTRSFLYIDECIEAVRRLMDSDVEDIINIGSEEMISINNLAKMTSDIRGKDITIKNIPGPVGVSGRNSDNTLINKLLGWAPSDPLEDGMRKTYEWIREQVENAER
jgi:GDP-D-mannose 3',5'-epimerase